jgi:hypothetical protein
MALLQTETLDAFRAAGAPEPEARAAAIAAADIDVRHTVMAERLNGIDAKLTLMIGVMLVGFGAMLAAFWQVFLRLPR